MDFTRIGYYSVVGLTSMAWLNIIARQENKLPMVMIFSVCLLISIATRIGMLKSILSNRAVAFICITMYYTSLVFYMGVIDKGEYYFVFIACAGLGVLSMFADVIATVYSTILCVSSVVISFMLFKEGAFYGLSVGGLMVILLNIVIQGGFVVVTNMFSLKSFNSVTASEKVLESKNTDLLKIFDKINETTKTIRTIDAHVIQSIDNISSSTDNINQSVEEFSASTEEQTANIEEIGSSVNSMTDSIGKVTKFADNLMKEVMSAKEVLSDNLNSLKEMFTAITVIIDNVSETKSTANDLSDYMGKVKKFVHNIEDIANTTTLVSFNARIEAANANGGERFAVVANEIGNLAKQSKEYTAEITEIMETLASHTVNVLNDVNTIETTLSSTTVIRDKSIKQIENFEAVFNSTINTIKTITSNLIELNSYSDNVNSNTNAIMEVINSNNASLLSIQNDLSSYQEDVTNLRDQLNLLANLNSELEVAVKPV